VAAASAESMTLRYLLFVVVGVYGRERGVVERECGAVQVRERKLGELILWCQVRQTKRSKQGSMILAVANTAIPSYVTKARLSRFLRFSFWV
jgi:hypothetical protein